MIKLTKALIENPLAKKKAKTFLALTFHLNILN